MKQDKQHVLFNMYYLLSGVYTPYNQSYLIKKVMNS